LKDSDDSSCNIKHSGNCQNNNLNSEHNSPDCTQANSSLVENESNLLNTNGIVNERVLFKTNVIENANNLFKTNVIPIKNIILQTNVITNNSFCDLKCCQFYSDCVECLGSLYSDLSRGQVCRVLGHPVHLVECQKIIKGVCSCDSYSCKHVPIDNYSVSSQPNVCNYDEINCQRTSIINTPSLNSLS
jgi:hypothetical protein